MPRLNLLEVMFVVGMTSIIVSPVLGFADESACYSETGYCLHDAAIVDYFQAHGAQEVLGYPISRPFVLRGARVQLFQRAGLQLQSDDLVRPLDLLADNLLPARRMLGANLPVVDETLLQRAPRSDEADFSTAAEQFLEAEVPNVFEGLPVGFLDAYRAVDAASGGIMAGLELYGWPTSPPTRDAGVNGAIYQRFQRAILRFGMSDRHAEPLFLGDYVKAVLTGRDLPVDLEQELGASPLLRQYNPDSTDGLHRPWDLPATLLANAFERDDAAPRQVLSRSGPGEPGEWPISLPLAESTSEGYGLRVDGPASQERGMAVVASGGTIQPDVSLVADLRLAEGTLAGYSFGLPRGDRSPPLSLVIDAQRGLATLVQKDLDSSRVVWSWGTVPALRPPPEINRWTIRTGNARLAVWVNGSALFDLAIGRQIEGRLGLGAVTWSGPARVVMSSFVVTSEL